MDGSWDDLHYNALESNKELPLVISFDWRLGFGIHEWRFLWRKGSCLSFGASLVFFFFFVRKRLWGNLCLSEKREKEVFTDWDFAVCGRNCGSLQILHVAAVLSSISTVCIFYLQRQKCYACYCALRYALGCMFPKQLIQMLVMDCISGLGL
jgi:hypothetical protein